MGKKGYAIGAIEVENLTKRYESYARGASLADTFKSLFHRKKVIVNAVTDLSFTVPEGQLVGLLGPNGAGKSTLMKMLTGVMLPTSGEARVLGFNPWRQRSRYVGHIGAVFGQKSQLVWDIPPLDSFTMNKAIYGIPGGEFKRRLSELTELFGAGDVIRKPTRQLSLGERMKCEFIMALLHGPRIVFLDEPTIGLDIIAKARIRDVILAMNAQGVTFVLTTHDIGDIDKLARRVIMINRGKIAFDGSIHALKGMTGSRKTLRIIAQNPLEEINAAGVESEERISDYEAAYTVDTGIFGMDEFISLVNGRFGIRDIQVDELPIEQVIRRLYAEAEEESRAAAQVSSTAADQ